MDNQKKKGGQLFYLLALLLGALIWGSAFVGQSIGAGYVGALTFLTARSWIAFFFLIPVIAVIDLVKDGRVKKGFGLTGVSGREVLAGGLVCGLWLFLASFAQQAGIAYTTTAKSGFITALYVVIVPFCAMFLGQRVEKKMWVCVLVAVIGMYLLCMKGSFSLALGDGLILLCAFLFAGQIMAINHYAPKVDGVRLCWLEFLTVALISTVFMFVFEKPVWAEVMKAMPSMLYVGIMSSGVAYTLQIIGQAGLSPTVASLAMCMESVFSALFGWLILHQSLSPRELAGCCLMFAAIAGSQLGPVSPVSSEAACQEELPADLDLCTRD
ncbi:MAG: DMT family transporter [Lachnospiraceae bacterium]|nr:DMT family transporter [Lachnospiraceae bacterium]